MRSAKDQLRSSRDWDTYIARYGKAAASDTQGVDRSTQPGPLREVLAQMKAGTRSG